MTTAPLDLHLVQRIRKVAVLVALVALIGLATVTGSIGGAESDWHEVIEAVGLAAIALAIVGRAWCSLYIGGRKKAEIVDRGPIRSAATRCTSSASLAPSESAPRPEA
jgi:protein-S-isoprenylcysteine O-methyltransferase Ste14